jgi:hypothetical protein
MPWPQVLCGALAAVWSGVAQCCCRAFMPYSAITHWLLPPHIAGQWNTKLGRHAVWSSAQQQAAKLRRSARRREERQRGRVAPAAAPLVIAVG